MSTMLKVKKEDNGATMTPEGIVGKLFSFHNSAHKFHLDTKSFATHKALDELYTSLVGFKDGISELLMGYNNGKRIGKIRLDDIPDYSDDAVRKMLMEGMEFSKMLGEWAEEKNYCDIENTAQSLSGQFSKTLYLLTLT